MNNHEIQNQIKKRQKQLEQVFIKYSNSKTNFKKLEYLLQLHQYDQAIEVFSMLNGADKQSRQYKQLQEKINIFALQSKGQYDWQTIINKQRKESFFLSINNYISDEIESFSSEEMGTGYKAKEKILPGQLIMVEKAFLIGSYQEMNDQLQLQIKYISKEQKQKYINLCGGQNDNPFSFSSLVEKVDLNAFQIQQQLVSDNYYRNSDADDSAVFLNSALFNHSCSCNVETLFINDISVKFAIKVIDKNEQLFNCYTSLGMPTIKYSRQKMLEQYHFSCQCQICTQLQKIPNIEANIDDLLTMFDYFYLEFYKETQQEKIENSRIRVLLKQCFQQLVDLEQYCTLNGIFLQTLFGAEFRKLTKAFLKYMVKAKDEKRIYFAIKKQVQYLGINYDEILNKGQCELQTDCENKKYTSYIDIIDLIIISQQFYIMQNEDLCAKFYGAAKQLHQILLKQFIDFEILWKNQINEIREIYELYIKPQQQSARNM